MFCAEYVRSSSRRIDLLVALRRECVVSPLLSQKRVDLALRHWCMPFFNKILPPIHPLRFRERDGCSSQGALKPSEYSILHQTLAKCGVGKSCKLTALNTSEQLDRDIASANNLTIEEDINLVTEILGNIVNQTNQQNQTIEELKGVRCYFLSCKQPFLYRSLQSEFLKASENTPLPQ